MKKAKKQNIVHEKHSARPTKSTKKGKNMKKNKKRDVLFRNSPKVISGNEYTIFAAHVGEPQHSPRTAITFRLYGEDHND